MLWLPTMRPARFRSSLLHPKTWSCPGLLTVLQSRVETSPERRVLGDDALVGKWLDFLRWSSPFFLSARAQIAESEPGRSRVWPSLFASAVRIGKVRSRSR